MLSCTLPWVRWVNAVALVGALGCERVDRAYPSKSEVDSATPVAPATTRPTNSGDAGSTTANTGPTSPEMTNPPANPDAGMADGSPLPSVPSSAMPGPFDSGAPVSDPSGGQPDASTPVVSPEPSDPVLVPASCGDTQLDPGEACDDGNQQSFDGCSFDCQTEQGWSLSVQGVLSPAFDPSIQQYSVKLPLFVESLSLVASAPAGAELAIESASLPPDGAWQSPVLELGETDVELQLWVDGELFKSYLITVQRGEPEQYYFKASNTGQGDQFGESVALSADGSTLAVGAPEEDSGPTQSGPDEALDGAGAVYVFRRSNRGWSQQAFIKAHSPGPGDHFGGCVALSADGNRLVVGAQNEADGGRRISNTEVTTNTAPSSGAVYVYDYDAAGGWKQKAFIKVSNSREGIGFGHAVALSADGSTLAATADSEGGGVGGVGSGEDIDISVPGSGAAYVFVRGSAGAWSQQAYIKASEPGSLDFFGHRVALSGDGNTLAVGAYWEDSSGGGVVGGSAGGVGVDDAANNSGAVYVFSRSSGAWSQQAFVKASNPGSSDEFGQSLALNGEGNVLAVGAHREDGSGSGVSDPAAANDDLPSSGAVYVFERTGVAWSQAAYLKASNPGNDDRFGFSVALDHSGRLLAVGAYQEDGAGTLFGDGTDTENGSYDSGAVYLFERRDSWAQRAYLKALNNGEADFFGWSSSFSADGTALAVGARAEESSESGPDANPNDDSWSLAGAVYVTQ